MTGKMLYVFPFVFVSLSVCVCMCGLSSGLAQRAEGFTFLQSCTYGIVVLLPVAGCPLPVGPV